MSTYISSSANRFYTALESAYGSVGSITATNRIPAIKLGIQQQVATGTRRDKTGSRTFAGVPAGVRRRTDFDLETYLTSWDKTTAGPGYGALFQAALGGSPVKFGGGTAASSTATGRLGFGAPHGLAAGQALCFGGEIRFVTAIVDAQTVQLNAPFTVLPAAGAAVTAAVTYTLATQLPSASIFDYWSPATAVQRLLSGAGVDQMDIVVDGDYHQFHFKGVAQDLLDSASFEAVATAKFSGGAGGGGVRLLDRAREHGAGVAGDGAIAVLHDHGRDDHIEERTGHAGPGIRIERGVLRSAGDFTGRAHGDGGVRPLRARRRCHNGTVPGGAAAIANQRDVPTGGDGRAVDGRVSEERGAGSAGVRRWAEPAAVAIPGIAGTRDRGR